MLKPAAQSLIRRLRRSGIDAKLHERYSGRFMFGRETCGVVSSAPPDLVLRKAKQILQRDNLGNEWIYY